MRSFKHSTLLLIALLFSSAVYAQKSLKIADKLFKIGDYYSAVEYYQNAFETKEFEDKKEEKKLEPYYQYAEACRKSYSFAKAEAYYEKVANAEGGIAKFPEVGFYYPYTLKHNAKYGVAKEGFEAFVANAKNSKDFPALYRQAEQEIKSCELAMEIFGRPIDGIEVIALEDNVNTKFSDFAPHLVGNDLYYSSLKFEAQTQRRAGANESVKKHLYGKIMISKEKGQKVGALAPGLNRKYVNIGNSTLSPDGQKLYYTVCEKNENYEFECEIYVAERKGSGWGKGEALPKNINPRKHGITNTHPMVALDTVSGKEYLYFASSRDGGYGKMDIWVSEVLADGEYADPKNLGAIINTEGDEATPFFHNPTQTLYFSSTWHPGLGGYDIFKSKPEGSSWTTPENVGVPLNSAANDLYFYISPDVDTFGYFSSNRPGSKVLTGESCCNDIYALSLPTDIRVGDPVELVAMVDPDELKEPEPEPIPEPEPTPTPEPEPTPEPIPEPTPEPEPVPAPPLTVEEVVADLTEELPITLYFHNDRPNPKTYATTTTRNYDETYVSYINMKEEYRREYAAQYADAEMQKKAQQDVDQFFTKSVEGEYARLNKALEQLIGVLEKGETLELYIRGFCSPRSSSSYNKNLAKRRISCMLNQIEIYKNGVFKEYIDNGQLKFIELPIGESAVPKGVSDDVNDPRNSIYSPDAARQRKVHLETIKLKEK
jgi:hypothetical protein